MWNALSLLVLFCTQTFWERQRKTNIKRVLFFFSLVLFFPPTLCLLSSTFPSSSLITIPPAPAAKLFPHFFLSHSHTLGSQAPSSTLPCRAPRSPRSSLIVVLEERTSFSRPPSNTVLLSRTLFRCSFFFLPHQPPLPFLHSKNKVCASGTGFFSVLYPFVFDFFCLNSKATPFSQDSSRPNSERS